MKNRIIRVAVFLAIVVGITLAVLYREQFDVATLEQSVADAGVWGPLLFMLIYAVGTILFLPGSVLTLAGGALFGPVWGTFYNLTGATLGAAVAFLAARYLASAWVEQKSGKRVRQLQEGVEGEGWRFIAFVRLVPLFPFNLLNYALGLTRIRFWEYVIASWIFMLPGAIAYTYLGYVGREAVAGDADVNRMIQLGTIAFALLGVVAFIPRLVARLRRGPMLEVTDLKQYLDDKRDMLVLDVRDIDEFFGEQGHLAGVKHIPLRELAGRTTELADYVEKPVAIICRTDRRSAKAAQILTRLGFADVHIVRGGMMAWHAAGYPVETSH